MPTTTLTTGNDTYNLKIGIQGALSGGAYSSVKGYLIDAGTGTDTLVIVDTYQSGNYTLSTTGDGIITLTTSSGSATFTNFEKIQFSGGVTINLGTSGNDTITGTNNSKADVILYGLAGDDTIDGGTGADKMWGGQGNDTYIVDNSDIITELAGEGTDTVLASVSYSLVDTDGTGANGGNVENLTLTGTAIINGTGNALDNVLTGNSSANTLTANAGNDTIDGGAGADTMLGGLGDDTYYVDNAADVVTESAGQGTDTVYTALSYALGSEVENLVLTGTAAVNGTGNILANAITGNSGNNVLDGGADALVDTLDGGAGDDTYVLADGSDTVIDASGIDTITSTITRSLAVSAGIEKLTLLGTAAIDGTGNALANTITGNSGNNVLDGGADSVVDTLDGGAGDDTYVLGSGSDTVTDASGTDTITSTVTRSLAGYAAIENLTLSGTAAIDGTGNALANTITGNSGNNVLDGGADALADTLDGGAGDDTYVLGSGSDAVSDASGIDTITSTITRSLAGYTGIEKLTLLGAAAIDGTGNTLANTIAGNSAANILDGGTGADTLVGGAGDDTYVIDNSADVITEASGEGTDTAKVSAATYTLSANVENLEYTGAAAFTGTGNTLANVIKGGTGADTLSGDAGNDTVNAGTGNDTVDGGADQDTLVLTGVQTDYTFEVIDATHTRVTDNRVGGDGIDTITNIELVQFSGGSTVTLAALLATSAIQGTAGDDILNGTSSADTIIGYAGNDQLDGGLGGDTMLGGADNDTYVVDDISDVVTELANEGTDEVQASISYALGANVENLTLTGTAANGTGNDLDNTIAGNASNNTLDGGIGADALVGDAGDDIYIVDNIGDTVFELAGDGTDEVRTGISLSLAAEVEKLTLTGTAAIDGTGNELVNTITGNSGDNVLDGGADGLVDTLDGGAGNDTFVLSDGSDVVSDASGTDTITSTISRSLTGFAGIENLTLLGTAAIDGTGNALANALAGNSGDNVLDGGADSLVDTLNGGAGNDTYILGSGSDSVTDASGTDTITSTITRSLSGYGTIENLTLSGTASIDGTGNTLANTITGNSGSNVLDGGADALVDTLDGGAGDDTYLLAGGTDTVADASGTDTITSTISRSLTGFAGIENLTLLGAAAIDGAGNALANIITGNSGNNVLDGGADALVDALVGGAGDDTYVLADGADTVTDASGTDTITSTTTRSLTGFADIENLTLLGAAAINGSGNALANTITGNGGNNVLDGGADALADTLVGGAGDDTYVLADGSDTVTDASGSDTITSTMTRSLTGFADIENLTLLGTAAINGTGNALANTITGNDGNNVLNGGADALVDTLVGGLGNDTYVLGAGADVVTDTGGTDTITSTITRSLAGSTTVENLTLLGTAAVNGTGNALANVIMGNAGNNVLNGGADTLVDTLNGGLGNDTYVLGAGADKVADTGGIDTIWSTITRTLAPYATIENLTLLGATAINGTGNALGNTIVGNAAKNIITGGAGRDVMTGGDGADVFDFNVVTETTKVAGTRDVIRDFVHLSDKIDLSTIDANANLAGNQAFTFLALKGAAFTGVAGQLHYVASGANTIVEGDVNGDKVADFQIQLDGTKTLTAPDFVL